MKVYVVHEAYEPVIHGVFLSKQRAEEVVKQLEHKSGLSDGWFWLEEYEVDQE